MRKLLTALILFAVAACAIAQTVTAVQYRTAAGPRLWFPKLQEEAGLVGSPTIYRWSILLSRETMGVHEPFIYQSRADVTTWHPDPEMALLSELQPGMYYVRASIVLLDGSLWGNSSEMTFTIGAPSRSCVIPWALGAVDGWTSSIAIYSATRLDVTWRAGTRTGTLELSPGDTVALNVDTFAPGHAGPIVISANGDFSVWAITTRGGLALSWQGVGQ